MIIWNVPSNISLLLLIHTSALSNCAWVSFQLFFNIEFAPSFFSSQFIVSLSAFIVNNSLIQIFLITYLILLMVYICTTYSKIIPVHNFPNLLYVFSGGLQNYIYLGNTYHIGCIYSFFKWTLKSLCEKVLSHWLYYYGLSL